VKTCRLCGVARQATAEFFYFRLGRGLDSRCKLCVIQKSKAWADAHPGRGGRRYWQDAERNRQRGRESYARNRAAGLARAKTWAEANRDKTNAYKAAWLARNPEYTALKKARKRGGSGDQAIDWPGILEYFGHRCAYCLSAEPMTRDHLEPIALGGRHTAENVIPACMSCNTSKGKKPLLQWLMAVAV
jgi:5-methylcytosine-specific restriction endonuclease McrA